MEKRIHQAITLANTSTMINDIDMFPVINNRMSTFISLSRFFDVAGGAVAVLDFSSPAITYHFCN